MTNDRLSNAETASVPIEAAAATIVAPQPLSVTVPAGEFLFIACQPGSEGICKQLLHAAAEDYRFAYSRPGFLTFKRSAPISDAAAPIWRETLPPPILAHRYGASLAKVTGGDATQRADGIWQQIAATQPTGRYAGLHVWARGMDIERPGTTDVQRFAAVPIAIQALQQLAEEHPERLALIDNTQVQVGDCIANVVIVEHDEWWLVTHRVESIADTWPGAVPPGKLPADSPSRGWLKMAEAAAWSRLPFAAGERCCEIGCSPGGASWYLLQQGLHVTGVDPAAMGEKIVKHPRFVHLRQRARNVDRQMFHNLQWLVVDINLPPVYTLDTAESVLNACGAKPRGVLLTLKMRDWSLMLDWPMFRERIAGWGFGQITARHLFHNHQEICVFAEQQARSLAGPLPFSGIGRRTTPTV